MKNPFRFSKNFPVLIFISIFALFVSYAGASGIIVHENGNVGIGTVNPGKKLHIVGGDARFENTNNIYFDINSVNGGSSNVYYRLLSAGDAKAALAYDAYDGVTLGRIITGNIQRDIFIRQNNGNIGFGTTNPNRKLEVIGDIGVTDDSGQNRAQLILSASTEQNMAIIGSGRTNTFAHTDLVLYSQNNGGGVKVMTLKSSGSVGIGTASPSYKLDVNGTIRGSNVSPSDARWKTNIHTIEDPLEKVAQLRGITYEWADPSKGIGEQIGVIAQEVEQVFPQAVSTDNEGYKSVAYARLAAPMIEAIKELKNENDLLKQEISALKSAVQTLIKERETR